MVPVMELRPKLIYCKINLYFIRFGKHSLSDMTWLELRLLSSVGGWQDFPITHTTYMILSWEISQWAWEQGTRNQYFSTSLPPHPLSLSFAPLLSWCCCHSDPRITGAARNVPTLEGNFGQNICRVVRFLVGLPSHRHRSAGKIMIHQEKFLC